MSPAPAAHSRMARDPAAAAAMVFAKIGDYEAIQQQSLSLKIPSEGIVAVRSPRGSPVVELDVLLQPDDLRVPVFPSAPVPGQATNATSPTRNNLTFQTLHLSQQIPI